MVNVIAIAVSLSMVVSSQDSITQPDPTSVADLGAKRVTNIIQAEYQVDRWQAVSLTRLLESIAPEKVTTRLTTDGIEITAKLELQQSISKFITASLTPNREESKVKTEIEQIDQLLKEEHEKSKGPDFSGDIRVRLKARRLELLEELLKVREGPKR